LYDGGEAQSRSSPPSMTGDWRTVASWADFPNSGLLDVEVDGMLVLLVKQNGDVRAVQGLCPHAFARLAGGRVDEAGALHCPRHLARFSLDDGACLSGWIVPPLKRYAVRVEDGAVQLPFPLIASD